MGNSEERDRRPGTGRLLLGLGLMLLGAALLLERAGLVGHELVHWVAPLLLVAIGLWKLLRPGQRGGGLQVLVTGILLLLHVLGVARLHETWPVFVVTAGAAIIVRALDQRRPGASEEM